MKKTIDDIDVLGKRVLLRVDFNVPLDDNLQIVDDTRIVAELPTIKTLLKRGARLIICSHLGRPKPGADNSKYSLLPVAKYLIKNLLNKVYFCQETVGVVAEQMANNLKNGEVLLLENVRFYTEEEDNDPIFAQSLARLADIYVNDAFGTAHRNHASIVAVAKLLPNAVGYLMSREINAISSVVDNPKRPFVAILGGAKVSDKIGLIKNVIEKCDTVLIGGGMAFTFLKAQGHSIGKSLFDAEKLDLAAEILQEAKERNVNVVLPVDFLGADSMSLTAKKVKIKGQEIPNDLMGLDIGRKTIKMFVKEIKKANSLIWNGPMGVFEIDNFSRGTLKIAKAICKFKGRAVVGGGDSIAALNKIGKADNVYHISTGGGASLKLMSGESLVGVDVIEDKD